MSEYRLSERADLDILDIYLFGVETFGRRQAARYKAELDHCFGLLAEQPRMGRLAENFGPNVRRHEHGSHVILYEIKDDHTLILAIPHANSVHGFEL